MYIIKATIHFSSMYFFLQLNFSFLVSHEALLQRAIANSSSCSEVFYRKGVLINSAKLKGKHLYQSLFFNKVGLQRPATLLKKRLWHRRFCEISKSNIFTKHLQKLLLKKSTSNSISVYLRQQKYCSSSTLSIELFINICASKNAIVLKNAIFYLLCYNVTR